MTRSFGCVLLILSCAWQAAGQSPYSWEEGCAVRFGGRYGQVEAGGPLAGIECHDSRPLPSRVSLYAPVANSIDLSTDYWKRGDSRPFVVGVRVDQQQKQWLGKEPWDYVASPHAVRFERTEGDLRYTIRYDFGSRLAAVVMTIGVVNTGSAQHDLELYTHMTLVLRSCQTYARIVAAQTTFDRGHHAILGLFDDPRVARAAVIVQNAGLAPSAWTTSGEELGVQDSGWSNWIEREDALASTLARSTESRHPVAAFMYRCSIPSGDSTAIVQLVSSTSRKEAQRTVVRAAKSWREDVASYRTAVRQAAYVDACFHSGHAWTDSSVAYSRALLEANQHYLNGVVAPMPCPAEYNFFFTHDALLTNLSAIAFDPDRVRRDLLYIAGHAKGSVIPHAYYWKDDGFKTEYCSPGNWNNIWFILATASYLRHTMDTTTVQRLYPLLTKSLEQTLSRRSGNVMHGTEPDWWDFGHAVGARAYLTVLTIRALEEYVFVSAWLRKNRSRLGGYEAMASGLRDGLMKDLWDESSGYLLNTIGSDRDRHIYMGPLLAAVFGQLPDVNAQRLVATAGNMLVDSSIGIRTVFPADFHTDSVKSLYKVKGNEAGDAFTYANGGVWYLGNAWYARALRSIGDVEGSFDFYARTMTVDGIVQSPSGHPALYEYRYANPDAAAHGWIDKPTMMWSAGFCIGTAYLLAGLEDNVWNVTAAGKAARALEHVRCTYAFGGRKTVERRGSGPMLIRLVANTKEIPSRILPLDARGASSLTVDMGAIRYPFLDSVNAILHTASLDPDSRILRCVLSSFNDHLTTVRVITPWLARSVAINGGAWKDWAVTSTPTGTLVVTVRYGASEGVDTVEIRF
jgi:hypothetical protein